MTTQIETTFTLHLYKDAAAAKAKLGKKLFNVVITWDKPTTIESAEAMISRLIADKTSAGVAAARRIKSKWDTFLEGQLNTVKYTLNELSSSSAGDANAVALAAASAHFQAVKAVILKMRELGHADDVIAAVTQLDVAKVSQII